MENDNAGVATEVWVLFRFELGISVSEGLFPLGVFDTREKAEIALARNYEDTLENYENENIPDLFYIKSSHLCDITVPNST